MGLWAGIFFIGFFGGIMLIGLAGMFIQRTEKNKDKDERNPPMTRAHSRRK